MSGGLFGGADLLGEAVEGDAFGAGDVALVGIVREGGEDEKATLGNGIKEGIGESSLRAEQLMLFPYCTQP